jgi:hypothetical protein
MWARQSYRWSDLDFEANARDGWGRLADPLSRYRALVQLRGGVCRITGQAEGLPQLPDGRFAADEMNCAEIAVKEAMAWAVWARS